MPVLWGGSTYFDHPQGVSEIVDDPEGRLRKRERRKLTLLDGESPCNLAENADAVTEGTSCGASDRSKGSDYSKGTDYSREICLLV